MWNRLVYFVLLTSVVGLTLDYDMSIRNSYSISQRNYFITLTANDQGPGLKCSGYYKELLFSMEFPQNNSRFDLSLERSSNEVVISLDSQIARFKVRPENSCPIYSVVVSVNRNRQYLKLTVYVNCKKVAHSIVLRSPFDEGSESKPMVLMYTNDQFVTKIVPSNNFEEPSIDDLCNSVLQRRSSSVNETSALGADLDLEPRSAEQSNTPECFLKKLFPNCPLLKGCRGCHIRPDSPSNTPSTTPTPITPKDIIVNLPTNPIAGLWQLLILTLFPQVQNSVSGLYGILRQLFFYPGVILPIFSIPNIFSAPTRIIEVIIKLFLGVFTVINPIQPTSGYIIKLIKKPWFL